MELLVVSTGRSGTRSCHKLIENLVSTQNDNKQVVTHECHHKAFYKGIMEYVETRRKDYVIRVLSKMTQFAEVGNGYQFVMPLIAEIFGRELRVIHLIRNHDDYVNSAINHMHSNREYWGNYQIDSESTIEFEIARPTSYHYGECTRAEWEKMSSAEQVSWNWHKSRALVRASYALFNNYMEINTTDLNDSKKVAEIAEFIGISAPKQMIGPRLNNYSYFYDFYKQLPHEVVKHRRHLFKFFDTNKAFLVDGYACQYFLENEIMEYSTNKSPQNRERLERYLKELTKVLGDD